MAAAVDAQRWRARPRAAAPLASATATQRAEGRQGRHPREANCVVTSGLSRQQRHGKCRRCTCGGGGWEWRPSRRVGGWAGGRGSEGSARQRAVEVDCTAADGSTGSSGDAQSAPQGMYLRSRSSPLAPLECVLTELRLRLRPAAPRACTPCPGPPLGPTAPAAQQSPCRLLKAADLQAPYATRALRAHPCPCHGAALPLWRDRTARTVRAVHFTGGWGHVSADAVTANSPDNRMRAGLQVQAPWSALPKQGGRRPEPVC